MKNQTISVTAAIINSEVDTMYDCRLILTSSGLAVRNQSKSFPRQFFFVNDTGEDIEFNILREDELEEFALFPSRFTGILVADNATYASWLFFGNAPLENIAFIKVKGLDTGASSDLTVYCLNYE